jgi:hypothetical protein
MSATSPPSRRSSWAIAFANAFSASDRVSPSAAFTICSTWPRSSETVARLLFCSTPTISTRSRRKSSNVGSGTSRTETSFSSSTGIVRLGDRRITVV